jgi:hypothetical protein
MEEFRRSEVIQRVFLVDARIIFRNLIFLGGRIAVPAVLDNRASRLLEFRYGDEISGRRSGTLRTRSGAGCSSHTEMRSPADGAGRSGHGLEQDAPATLRLRSPG